MIEPGVYNTVDPVGLKKLQADNEQLIDENKIKAKTWAKHKEEYKTLKHKLSTITDKTHYNVMVPFGGKKAFFEGQLVHTNEIMVLLGDNWFVERSAKDASEICQRRLDRCEEMLENLEKENKLFKSWLNEADQLGQDENLLEIREPYDEKEENKWREKHRKRLKQARFQASDTADTTKEVDDEDNLWQRLDELELEEELDAHLEAQKNKESSEAKEEEEEDEEGESDWSESPPLSDEDETEEEEEKTEVVRGLKEKNNENTIMGAPQRSVSLKEKNTILENTIMGGPRRSVSFGDVSERLFSREQDNGLLKETIPEQPAAEQAIASVHSVVADTKIIEFQPTKTNFSTSVVIGDNPNVPNSPGDIVRLYGAKQTTLPTRKKAPKKSILKADSKYGPLIKSEKQVTTPPSNTPRVSLKKPVAVSDVVVERKAPSTSSNSSGEASKTPVTQVLSRFRATRVQQ